MVTTRAMTKRLDRLDERRLLDEALSATDAATLERLLATWLARYET